MPESSDRITKKNRAYLYVVLTLITVIFDAFLFYAVAAYISLTTLYSLQMPFAEHPDSPIQTMVFIGMKAEIGIVVILLLQIASVIAVFAKRRRISLVLLLLSYAIVLVPMLLSEMEKVL